MNSRENVLMEDVIAYVGKAFLVDTNVKINAISMPAIQMYAKEMVTVKCKRGLHDCVKQCCAKVPRKCLRKVDWSCDGREGVVHTFQISCYINGKTHKCQRCNTIQEIKKKRRRNEKTEKRKRIWEEKLEKRKQKAKAKRELQNKKREAFETKKEGRIGT